MNLSPPTIFHHLRITVASPLIRRDRSLHLTIDNIIYALTPSYATILNTSYRLQLFLNSHNRMPYLLHSHGVSEQTTCRLEITTTLPSTNPTSIRSRQRPMLRATIHAPDLITNLTFPSNSPQYQLSIMTLDTPLLLTIPPSNSQRSWDIIHDVESHEVTGIDINRLSRSQRR